ncbi:unnamed protein product [Ranitomeya imitator]|uniref:C2H2-type domain-containing protein n=1 Tax=Ranitomeya imitator TaxID=111125 RepID=A0ABN9KZH3_9NEOB|nr:unnamed protein product [Ranitomeya imitator]
MAPTRDMSIETKERIIILLKEGKSSRNVAKDVGCSQSAVSKIWTKYKQHGKVVKGKHTGRSRKASKRQDRKLKAICLQNRKCTTKQMTNQWVKTVVHVCDRTVKKTYSCPACKKSFSDDRLIKSHIKANHPEVSASLISEVLGRKVQLKGLIGKRAAKCPYCDSYFMKNGSDLQRHIWAHEGLKPFKCTACDYATRSKSNLKAHMNRHSTEKTHLCDMCGKKFKTKGTLKSHKLLHTADGKQFKCTICEFTAVQKPQLLRHMEQHTSFKVRNRAATPGIGQIIAWHPRRDIR